MNDLLICEFHITFAASICIVSLATLCFFCISFTQNKPCFDTFKSLNSEFYFTFLSFVSCITSAVCSAFGLWKHQLALSRFPMLLLYQFQQLPCHCVSKKQSKMHCFYCYCMLKWLLHAKTIIYMVGNCRTILHFTLKSINENNNLAKNKMRPVCFHKSYIRKCWCQIITWRNKNKVLIHIDVFLLVCGLDAIFKIFFVHIAHFLYLLL